MAKQYLVPAFLVVTAESELAASNKLSKLQTIAMAHGFWLYQDELIQPKQVEEFDKQSARSLLNVINLEEFTNSAN